MITPKIAAIFFSSPKQQTIGFKVNPCLSHIRRFSNGDLPPPEKN
jgi:hypothetical protein